MFCFDGLVCCPLPPPPFLRLRYESSAEPIKGEVQSVRQSAQRPDKVSGDNGAEQLRGTAHLLCAR